MGLTPNRADCLSIEGLAREVAVLNQQQFQVQSFPSVAVEHQERLAVEVQDSAACPVYLGRLIKNINPNAVTPLWLQERLRRSGIRSLSPVVDVTNYVLIELGQPLHAFDADKLQAPIIVRRSNAGETLALLNDQTITLQADTLVIADQQQPLALAGVMGGKASAVSDETQNIFLECAFFNPQAQAGKARAYGLHTDSSHRYERGVDFTLQQRAIERATQLIIDIAGGRPGVITEVCAEAHLPQRLPVNLSQKRISKVLAVELPANTIEQVFLGLGMQLNTTETGWQITPPGFSFDIQIEEYLLEELARIHGYNNLPSHSPLMRLELAKASEAVLPLARIQDKLVDLGYQEAITYSFVDPALQALVNPEIASIALKNPISSELAEMRTSLWSGLLTAAIYNINRQQTRVRLFESGLRFCQLANGLEQTKMLAGLALGTVRPGQWAETSRNIDFFDVKADVEALFNLTAHTIAFAAGQHPALHPGQTAKLINSAGEQIGWLGMLHPTLEKQLGFSSPVFLFEINQEALLNRTVPKFTVLSRFPSVRRDLALIIDDAIPASTIITTIKNCQVSVIRDVQIFDIYRGQGLPEASKSVAISLVLQDFNQTLTDLEIDAILDNILKVLADQHQAKLRE